MEKQLILVVHGVGVREAGVATGHISAALGEALGGAEKPSPTVPLWRPHATDDSFLHEEKAYADNGILPVFPTHVRRFRRYDLKRPAVVQQERLVADFYWGDISATGTGGVRVAVGLVKIVLGLSHAIRENAMDVFPGKAPRAVWMRRIARLAALTIHGPIAAISIMLVVGLVLTLGVHAVSGRAWLVDREEYAPVFFHLLLGVGTMGAAWLGLQKSQVYLLRHLMGSLIGVGALVILGAGLEWLAPDWVRWINGAVDKLVFGTECMYRRGCFFQTAGFAVLGAMLMGLMMACWTVVILAALVVQVGSWSHRWFPERGQVVPIVAPAIALMTILWFVLMTVLWAGIMLVHWIVATATGYHLPRGLSVELAIGCLRLVTPAIAVLVALGLAAVGLHFRKAAAFGSFSPADYLTQRDDLADRHRLIVGWWLCAVLSVFPALMAVLGGLVITECQFLPETDCLTILDRNQGLIPFLVAIVGATALALAISGGRELATGVAIFTDVLVYLNDYSWRSREAELVSGRTAGGDALHTRTLTEHACGLRDKPDVRRQGYWLRGRIHSRMKVLMDTLLRDEKPSHLVIVSHSQGTVIAMDVIAKHGVDWLKQMPAGATLKLVTMGSPYTHLYNSYFPSAFPDVSQRKELGRVGDGGVLSEWVNIFRVDDFVGTHIDTTRNAGTRNAGRGWPEEVPVKPNGHTNYWNDARVFQHLRKAVGSNGKAGAAAAGGTGVGVLDDKAGTDHLL